MGTALAAALAEAGYRTAGPAGRDEVPSGEVLLLCVPDADIRVAAAAVAGAARFIGHTSGATSLAVLEPAVRAGAEVFGLHPLQSLTGSRAGLRGAGCAVAGSSPAAEAVATAIATALGMSPFVIDDEQRGAYHAAASIASNFLVTLEAAAERMAEAAGLGRGQSRALLAPLVRTTVDNWAVLGPEAALTGPVARGDEATIALQRDAVADAAPELIELFDVLLERTRALAAHDVVPAGSAA